MGALKKNQFGITSLLLMMVATAFSIVICQFLAGLSEEVFIVSLVVSGVSALVGFAMIGLSVLFAICIALTDEYAPLRQSNLGQCFHMFVMGMVAVGPALLMFAIAISGWKMY